MPLHLFNPEEDEDDDIEGFDNEEFFQRLAGKNLFHYIIMQKNKCGCGLKYKGQGVWSGLVSEVDWLGIYSILPPSYYTPPHYYTKAMWLHDFQISKFYYLSFAGDAQSGEDTVQLNWLEEI